MRRGSTDWFPALIIIGIVIAVFLLLYAGLQQSLIKNNLPPNATDIVELGNDWVTFRLKLSDGKDRYFLYRNMGQKTVCTELSGE
jgi:hypothetical protein